MKVICGLDLSINSSGLVKMYLDDNLLTTKIDYMSFTSVKKNSCENVYYYKKDDFNSYMDQNIFMRNRIKEFLVDVEYVAIEDYAFSAVGKVFHMAEYAGMIKLLCYESNKKIRLYDVGTIKIFGCGKGNGDKISMSQSFDKYESVKPKLSHLPIVDKSKGASPTSDIIDAYFICELLRIELSLRLGVVMLKELSEDVIKCFNRTSKAYPDNILSRDFLVM